MFFGVSDQAADENPLLLAHFNCHSLRHTFTTRMCEADVNVKVVQDALGHADVAAMILGRNDRIVR